MPRSECDEGSIWKPTLVGSNMDPSLRFGTKLLTLLIDHQHAAFGKIFFLHVDKCD